MVVWYNYFSVHDAILKYVSFGTFKRYINNILKLIHSQDM